MPNLLTGVSDSTAAARTSAFYFALTLSVIIYCHPRIGYSDDFNLYHDTA